MSGRTQREGRCGDNPVHELTDSITQTVLRSQTVSANTPNRSQNGGFVALLAIKKGATQRRLPSENKT